MFRASLCPLSGAQEYYTVVAACGIPQKLTKLFFTFLQHEISQAFSESPRDSSSTQ
jgi:hypothetical protein